MIFTAPHDGAAEITPGYVVTPRFLMLTSENKHFDFQVLPDRISASSELFIGFLSSKLCLSPRKFRYHNATSINVRSCKSYLV